MLCSCLSYMLETTLNNPTLNGKSEGYRLLCSLKYTSPIWLQFCCPLKLQEKSWTVVLSQFCLHSVLKVALVFLNDNLFKRPFCTMRRSAYNYQNPSEFIFLCKLIPLLVKYWIWIRKQTLWTQTKTFWNDICI